ncbi:hypothetical protein HYPSUDRAFT_204727 [Hypholoma sublateritium FD-334 SS-4]|uniref:Uncharacterized protein n=1 Tax=Hypholoma sublateritium (strain FD-334 SS-4) TaxID=945553 RepID=A0A0D2PGW2_HYPSF|nr:hypothetical protein HYPSUDRAFT_204727 [Hypholoma sublateritium FD-334 SS-4]
MIGDVARSTPGPVHRIPVPSAIPHAYSSARVLAAAAPLPSHTCSTDARRGALGVPPAHLRPWTAPDRGARCTRALRLRRCPLLKRAYHRDAISRWNAPALDIPPPYGRVRRPHQSPPFAAMQFFMLHAGLAPLRPPTMTCAYTPGSRAPGVLHAREAASTTVGSRRGNGHRSTSSSATHLRGPPLSRAAQAVPPFYTVAAPACYRPSATSARGLGFPSAPYVHARTPHAGAHAHVPHPTLRRTPPFHPTPLSPAPPHALQHFSLRGSAGTVHAHTRGRRPCSPTFQDMQSFTPNAQLARLAERPPRHTHTRESHCILPVSSTLPQPRHLRELSTARLSSVFVLRAHDEFANAHLRRRKLSHPRDAHAALQAAQTPTETQQAAPAVHDYVARVARLRLDLRAEWARVGRWRHADTRETLGVFPPASPSAFAARSLCPLPASPLQQERSGAVHGQVLTRTLERTSRPTSRPAPVLQRKRIQRTGASMCAERGRERAATLRTEPRNTVRSRHRQRPHAMYH